MPYPAGTAEFRMRCHGAVVMGNAIDGGIHRHHRSSLWLCKKRQEVQVGKCKEVQSAKNKVRGVFGGLVWRGGCVVGGDPWGSIVIMGHSQGKES